MVQHSAGILMYRRTAGRLEVLLAHPGGPFWSKRDEAAWSIPKGLYDPDAEAPIAAARREFSEETGHEAAGDLADLGTVRQGSGKLVRAFALEGDLDVSTLRSNTFELEWPPKSGRHAVFPEVDRGAWVGIETARCKLVAAQTAFLDRLVEFLGEQSAAPSE